MTGIPQTFFMWLAMQDKRGDQTGYLARTAMQWYRPASLFELEELPFPRGFDNYDDFRKWASGIGFPINTYDRSRGLMVARAWREWQLYKRRMRVH